MPLDRAGISAKLRKSNFACAPPEFENLLSQYQLYMDNENYFERRHPPVLLSFIGSTFFVLWAFWGIYRYAEITLADVTRCLAKISETFPCGIFNLTGSMRSFARFMAEKHPELPRYFASTGVLCCKTSACLCRIHSRRCPKDFLCNKSQQHNGDARLCNDYARIQRAYVGATL